MKWSKLLNSGRLNDPDYNEKADRPNHVQDLDRIVFSAPFRRLANKTQVHLLYDHDHIHHRLIHSVETGSAGRSLGMLVGHWLEDENYIDRGDRHSISGIVQAACLAHDIGNPPFGHSGEAAIGEWFTNRFEEQLGIFDTMDGTKRAEFEDFEGNAQGFRIIANLEMYRNEGGMRLSHSVLGAFTKYPITAHTKTSVKVGYCGVKKFGVFDAEYEIFSSVAEILGLPKEKTENRNWWRRHPLVFLVEAADDICYNILDIEDAYTSGDLSFEAAKKCLDPLAGTTNVDMSTKTMEEKISYMRARGIGAAIEACVQAFKENYDAIMDGTFSSSLIESSNKKKEFEEIVHVARSRIFTARRKTELEVSGRNTIHQVLSGLLPVYEELEKKKWDPSKLEGYNQQLVRAINLDLRDIADSYTALHSLTDYVSGMTDRYTVKIAKIVSGT